MNILNLKIQSRQIIPAVVNVKQYSNNTYVLNYTLDSDSYETVDLTQLDAYAITSINGLIDETRLTKSTDAQGHMVLTWNVMSFSTVEIGHVEYQIVFKDSGGVVWYSLKAMMIVSETIDADDHIVANYPSLLRQWEDWMAGVQSEVYQYLKDYTSGVFKQVFTADSGWVAGGIGYKLTLDATNRNLLHVWRENANGSFEQVVTGITCANDKIIIETLTPFKGFIMIATLNDHTVTAEVQEMYERSFENATIAAEARRDIETVAGADYQQVYNAVVNIDQKVASAATSATNASNAATTAQTTATALTTFLNTKETLTAPAIDATLSVSGAAADAKVVGKVSEKIEMLLADDVEYKINASDYGYKKGSSATVSSVDSNSITFVGNGGYAGIKYNTKVLPNTEYILRYDLKVNTGSASFDICDGLETTQIKGTNTVNNRDYKQYMVKFNSLAYNDIAIRFYGIASGDSVTVQNIKLIAVDNSKYINTDIIDFPFIGYLNYANGNITFNDATQWASTDYININAKLVIFNLFEFHNDSANVHLAMASFFDENYNIIEVVTENRHANAPAEMIIEIPSNAKYARFCKRTSGYSYTPYVTLITPVKDIIINNSIRLDNLEKEEVADGVNFKHFGYINKINLIGDSITQGVGVDIPENNSYAGILRKMFYIENDKAFNYGFESFSPLVELTTVTSKMVEQVSTGGFLEHGMVQNVLVVINIHPQQ